MDQTTAEQVVEKLRARGGFAHLHPVGVYEYSVRMVLRDGREAIWDADGAAGLEAVVLRDGVLVGLVETIPDSENLDVDGIVHAIAGTDYDAPLTEHARPQALPHSDESAVRPAARPAALPRSGLLRRLTGR